MVWALLILLRVTRKDKLVSFLGENQVGSDAMIHVCSCTLSS